MKAINYITFLALLVLGSCASSLYTGVEYDDLYYLPSDGPATRVQNPTGKQITEGNLKSPDYYDNKYAADTLVSDEYSDAAGAADLSMNSYGTDYDISGTYDYDSYSGKLRRFYGNSFYPYWRDPFYSSWGSPYYRFGYGGFPYYDPFYYDPFYYSHGYGYYDNYYGYGGYYGGSYGYNPYYSYYSPYYGNYGYWGSGSNIHYNDSRNSITYRHRDRQSSYSSKWNSNVPASGSARRDNYLSTKTGTDAARKSAAGSPVYSPDARRTATQGTRTMDAMNNSDIKSGQSLQREAKSSSVTPGTRSSVASRPEYKSTERTYTPSYNNPRMSTRPSYNNSRVNTDVSQRSNVPQRSSSTSESYRNSTVRSNPSYSSGQTRSVPSYNNSGSSYSVPSRRSAESSSGYSSGSYNSSSARSSSSSSSSSSSYSSGSGSRGYSSGSSSGSSGTSSGSRR